MKYILKNPTEEQIKSLKKLGLCIYRDSENIYVDVPEINDRDLPDGLIDLGLSVKWASCNIGADKPYEYGKLFQFGRADGYYYNDFNHKFYVGSDTPITTSGKTYAKGEVLNTADDAAYVATNCKLRMPTVEEIDELLFGTTNQWCQCNILNGKHTNNYISGRLFISKKNHDAKIFIPAAGNFSGADSSFIDAGFSGDIWSSSVYNNIGYTYNINFNSCGCFRYYRNRYYGFSIRGVCKY